MFPAVSGTIWPVNSGDIWADVGEAVLQRRLELGMRTREDLARAADLSSRSLSDLEKGRRQGYADGTYSALEQALGWPPGTIRGWLTRGHVTPVSAQNTFPATESTDLTQVPLEELLAEISRRAAAGEQSDVTLAARRRPATDLRIRGE